ncbi:actin cytoskeleton-regulatory complex protein pan1 isoform X2 [Magnolia sinica]|uniref:actin cytoskeleton-regulatory complex protein pan1 isoform X2 n=1 Tax=Magnolia sinica TaxID=86752 RepID=UPI00265944A9|nr:actin cytoskeleton-regulatory complex protein pan1 isoform X2 [Magnolia sinica]
MNSSVPLLRVREVIYVWTDMAAALSTFPLLPHRSERLETKPETEKYAKEEKQNRPEDAKIAPIFLNFPRKFLKKENRFPASTPAGDAHTLEFQEGPLKVADIQDLKNEDRKETILAEPNSDSQLEASNSNDVLKPISLAKAPAEVFSSEVCGNGFPPETLIKLENIEQQDSASIRISPTVDAFAVSPMEGNDVARASIKQEDGNTAADGLNGVKDESQNMGDLSGGSSSVAVDSETKPPVGYLRSTLQGVQSPCMLQDSNGAISLVSLRTNVKAKGEVEDNKATGSSELVPSPACDGKLDLVKHSPQRLGTSPVNVSENLQVHDSTVSSSLSVEHKSKGTERESEAVGSHNNDNTAEGMLSIPVEPHRCRQESDDLAGPLTVQEGSLKSRHVARYVEETSKSGGMNPSLPAPSLRRLVVGVGKSSSASSSGMVSKSSVSSTYKSVTTPSPPSVKSIHFSKQRVKVKSSTDRKKDNAASDAVRDESKQEVPRASVKDRVKSPASGPKTSQTNRISHATSTSKHSASDAKEQVLCPSAKASLTQSAVISSGSVEHSVSSQVQGASQSKHTAPGSKNEKISPSSAHPSSKVINHSPSMPPPAPVNASAILSDEELALLLHQELNSSPRVPRVPRMRHAGSVPQLVSPSATSMLAKRPSSSGGKDHISVSRRKPKEEACKDNSRNSRDQADESKKMNRLPPSPDNKRQDSAFTTDGLTKKDARNRSPDGVASAKKIMLVPSTPVANPPPPVESNDQNLPSIRSSPRDMLDDDVGGVARTLPGLIAEIISKGKRMTDDELCNAVLPHWNSLRKHNGEPYAYSTHSQAVLDCLKNQNELAQLIDRGPKTNSSRKRRKLDADPPVESETEDAKDNVTKPVEDKNVKSQQEDFPKGKRKARKRRRLTLQGRGLKEVRRRQKAEASADDDFGVYSHSSEGTEGIFSEDESQGGRIATFASDASTSSSDENGMV